LLAFSTLEAARLFSDGLGYARTDLKLKGELFLSGLAGVEDVLRAQQNLISAELALKDVLIQAKLASLQIYYFTGDGRYRQW